jgi:PAS domain S-box-containing protein
MRRPPSNAVKLAPPTEREAWVRHFAGAFENAVIGMTLLGTDKRRLSVNRAFCEFLGHTESELLGMALEDVIHPDDVQDIRRQLAALLAGEKDSYRRENRYRHRSGDTVWGDFSCTLARDLDGQPLFFITQVQDITERKLAERRLRDTQAMLHLAAQVGRLGAWAWDVGAETLQWSQEACAIFEVKPGFAPTTSQAMRFIAPAYRANIGATLKACLRGGSPFDIEAQIVTAKGHPLWVRFICEAEWDAHGRVRRLQGALQDISESKGSQQEIMRLNAELEERVHRRTAQLEAANRELEAFSYSIAHDLRAPLSSIDGFSSALQQSAGDALDERSQHYLRRIRVGVRQMSELTDGLLSLASLSRADLQLENVDIAALARSAVAGCRERSPERVVDIVIADSLPAQGDPRLLAQVMGNLVGNAWKFTARKAQARIEVGGARDSDSGGGQWVYYVRDDGAGFDMAYASKMFEAFRRMHTSAEFDGTGIGLAIAHRIITRHGGRIWADSAPDRGATFYFTLGEATG